MNKYTILALFLGALVTVNAFPTRDERNVGEKFSKLAGDTGDLVSEGWDFLKKLAKSGKDKTVSVLSELREAAEKVLPAGVLEEDEAEPEAEAAKAKRGFGEKLKLVAGDTGDLVSEGWDFLKKLASSGKDKTVKVLSELREAAEKVLPAGSLSEDASEEN